MQCVSIDLKIFTSHVYCSVAEGVKRKKESSRNPEHAITSFLPIEVLMNEMNHINVPLLLVERIKNFPIFIDLAQKEKISFEITSKST